MLTPDMMDGLVISQANIDNIISAIDSEMKKEHNISEYGHTGKLHIILDKEYPMIVRDMIVERYKEAGWRTVTHRTSSENGERPGLTGFTFYSNSYVEDLPDAE